MKLTKITLTEKIKLSEVIPNEQLYYWDCKTLCRLFPYGQGVIQDNNPCVIRDNKVINIIQDEEYNNDKPYLIGKDENHIIGFIEIDNDQEYYAYCSMLLYFKVNGTTLKTLLKHINKEGYNVYKQE